MKDERYLGIGRRKRRLMKKLWKEARPRTSLKAWARAAEVGDLAHVWMRAKHTQKAE
jgi:hypothetical protein